MSDSVNASSDYVTPRLTRWRELTDGPLLVVAIASLPMLLLELKRSDLANSDLRLLDVCNVVVLIVFAVDYVVELSLARHRGRFVRHEWTSLLIVVAQVITLLPGGSSAGALRLLRAGRVVRPIAALARAVAVGGAAASQGRSIVRQRAASFALWLAAFTWLTSAVAFTLLEDVGVERRVPTFGDAMWWSISTITTVGYGDVYPVTGAGRLLAAFTMLVGISSFAIVTAKVAEFLVRVDSKS